MKIVFLFANILKCLGGKHFRLAFFEPENQQGRPAGVDGDAAQRQFSDQKLQSFYQGPSFENDCSCVLNDGEGSCNAYCPEASSRMTQIQNALLEMGLLWTTS